MPNTDSIAEPDVSLISPLEIAAGIDQAITLLMGKAYGVNALEAKRVLRSAYDYLQPQLDIQVAAILHGETVHA